MNQPDQKLRGIAIGVLGEIGDASALAALSRIAASDDPWSDLARQNVAKIGGPDAATCLIGLLQRHVMGDRAARIADDLGAIGDNHAVEPLIQLLRGQLIGRRGVQDAYDRRGIYSGLGGGDIDHHHHRRWYNNDDNGQQ